MIRCDENPFGESVVIAPQNRLIQGQLLLSDGESPAGIYVWLERIDISTRTDSGGNFQLVLPPFRPLGPVENQSGQFRLFFYVANYRMTSVDVTILKGQFIPSRGDLDAEGNVMGTRSLRKLLDIHTTINPATVNLNNNQFIGICVSLTALFDSVVVRFPKIMGASSGALIFRHVRSGDLFVEIPDSPSAGEDVVKIGQDGYQWMMGYNFEVGALPEGEYEVIPYFLIEQEGLPDGLLDSIHPDATELGPAYLKIPFRRSGGRFHVETDM